MDEYSLVEEVSKILCKDPVLIRDYVHLCDELGLDAYTTVLRNQFYNNTISAYELFFSILENWVSRNGRRKATLLSLYQHLLNLGFVLSAERISALITTNSEHTREINKLNFKPEPAFNFFGRTQELERLEKMFSQKHKQLVLISGLGGIGKTELVKKFLTILKEKNKNITCKWINGDDAETLKITLSELRIWVQLEDNRNTSEEKSESQTCVVAIDNVDEENSEINEAIDSLCRLRQFFVIVTSRIPTLLDEEAELIELPELDLENAMKLVQSYFSTPQSLVDLKLLCETLQNFPLALHQAAAFIIRKQRRTLEGSGYSIRHYVNLFQNEQKTPKLLDYQSKSIEKYGRTTLTTWNLTLETIKETVKRGVPRGKIALKVLEILSFVNPDGIHLNFILQLYGTDDDKQITDADIKKSIQLLKKYSIIKSESCSITIHRMVQEVTRIRLKDETMQLLKQLLENINLESVKSEEIVHILQLWAHARKFPEIIKKFNTFPVQLFDKLIDNSLLTEASEFAILNHKLLTDVLTDDHIETLKMEANWATMLGLKNSFKEALEKYLNVYNKIPKGLRRSLKFRSLLALFRNPSISNPVSVSLSENIAFVHFQLENWNEALEWYSKISWLNSNVPPIDENQIIVINNFATTLANMERHEEAIKNYEIVFQWRKTFEGDENSDILSTRIAIAWSLLGIKKYDDAKKEIQSVFDSRLLQLGPDHVDTLAAKYLLAVNFSYFLN